MNKPDLAATLEHYGVDVPDRPGWAKIKCPIHEDAHASATCSTDDQAFACFACDVKGDVYTLIMKKEGVGFRDAVRIGETLTDRSVPTVQRQSERGLLGISSRKGNPGAGRRYVPPRHSY